MAKKMYSFKLEEETISDLDAIATGLAEMQGGTPNRSDALRYAARLTRQKTASKISGKKKEKSSK